jgi:hypothetical protein
MGNKGVYINIDLDALASLDLSVLQSSSTNSQLQANLVTEILNHISKVKSDFPEISKTKSDQEVKTIVTTEISTLFSMESLSQISMDVRQDQTLNVINNEDTKIKLKLQLEAKGVAKLINESSNSIATQLLSSTKSSSDTSSTQTNFLTDISNSVFNGVGGLVNSLSDFFSLSPWTLLTIIIIITIGGYFGYKYIEKNPDALKMGGYFHRRRLNI